MKMNMVLLLVCCVLLAVNGQPTERSFEQQNKTTPYNTWQDVYDDDIRAPCPLPGQERDEFGDCYDTE